MTPPSLRQRLGAAAAMAYLALSGVIAYAADDRPGDASPAGELRVISPASVGVRPGTPFVHLVGVSSRSGDQRFSAKGLPKGLSIDSKTGVISGVAPTAPGAHEVKLRVTEAGREAQSLLQIMVGDALALTPPMGWNSWNSFEGSISEQVVYEIADALERSGMRDAGYVYINLDDHWADINRELVVYKNNVSAEWRMTADKKRFPNGLKPIADALHARGFKLGVYSDAGITTCAEAQPAGYGYEDVDAKTFAEWGVDYLKYDYCYAPPEKEAAIERYTKMGRALEASGRSIVYSICEWGVRKPWEWGRSAGGHLWRTTADMRDHWEYTPGRDPGEQDGVGVLDAADFQVGLEKYQTPGGWNDPDMLIVGVDLANSSAHVGATGIGEVEERTMMSLWALMAAPLIVNADIRKLDPESEHYDQVWADRISPLLLNHEVIAVDQDALGVQGTRVAYHGDADVWAKPLEGGGVAVGLLNRGSEKTLEIAVSWNDLGLQGKYAIRDLWVRQDIGESSDGWTMSVKPRETALLRLTPASSK